MLQLTRLLRSFACGSVRVNNTGNRRETKLNMKTKAHVRWYQNKNKARRAAGSARAVLLAAAISGALVAASSVRSQPFVPSPLGDVFVIAMENHNFTQPATMTSPQQILGNPAAPYMNSLVTHGSPNAAQVSYAAAYQNAGSQVHPSEPNYVWAEAGTDFGVHTDADPRAANGNTFYAQSIHFTALLNAAGIPWKNYEEDVQLSVSPTNSASGTAGPVNSYNGSTQFNYAVKHNPMAFFTDTLVQNVYPLSQLLLDLSNNTIGRYNWITPDQYNDAHTALNGGFTYQGTHYSGDAANIAQGDNFLAQIVPQIMASPAYRNNGVIVIWWDETEGGDDTDRTLAEIVISPLAKGNAYASPVPMNHSSDIKTWSEVFTLPFLNNPIPAGETNNYGGYNNVALVNDFSDLFAPGAIPAPPKLAVTRGQAELDRHSGRIQELVHIRNEGMSPVPGPLWLVLDELNPDVALLNAAGSSAILEPLGSPYVSVPVGGDGILRPFETKTVALEFVDPDGAAIDYSLRVLDVTPAP